MPGLLYLVATPIGNLEDITLRALRILGEVDLIACEDTRHTRKLLTHFNIHKPLVSYHEHNERARSQELIEKLVSGSSIALVSDAGTPGISDPGAQIVSDAIQAGVTIVPVPGASALIAALIASGLPTDEFHFVGFLPSKMTARRAKLSDLKALSVPLIFYESPHRFGAMLADLLEILGDRRAVVARELTKVHEEFKRGSLRELVGIFADQEPRGEFVVIVEGLNVEAAAPQGSLADQVAALLESGVAKKEAIKQIARLNGIGKSEVYRAVLADEADQADRAGEIEAE